MESRENKCTQNQYSYKKTSKNYPYYQNTHGKSSFLFLCLHPGKRSLRGMIRNVVSLMVLNCGPQLLCGCNVMVFGIFKKLYYNCNCGHINCICLLHFSTILRTQLQFTTLVPLLLFPSYRWKWDVTPECVKHLHSKMKFLHTDTVVLYILELD